MYIPLYEPRGEAVYSAYGQTARQGTVAEPERSLNRDRSFGVYESKEN
jgi:hypothetical protein